MGAQTFIDVVKEASSAKEAFTQAVERAQWEHGHGGYTGTIAEKFEYKHVGSRPTLELALDAAEDYNSSEESPANDKWGPAGLLTVDSDPNTFVFFGWASS